jgi:phosphoribosylformylglycinamidine cyclo-ligase
MSLTYRDAGVDIDEGDRLVELLKPLARPTLRPEVLAGIGGFGGLFALDVKKYREPVLVSGTDGVGTKLKVAFEADRHDTVGIDLVAMCVNDVAVVGAEPLFFLDYFATGKLSAEQGAQVVKGIAEGCRQAGCALVGGETAELPGFYARGEYDLAGFAVGVVERSRIVDGKAVAPGDVVIGVASTGLHSNGYSLARKILERHPLDHRLDVLDGRTVAEALLVPTRIYAKDVLALLDAVPVRSFAHVTGGGLPGNVPRNLPDGTRAVLHEKRWDRPAVFDLLQRELDVPWDEMYRTFNMGLGLVAVVAPGDERPALATLAARGLQAWTVGQIERLPDPKAEATCEVVR